MHKMKTPNSLTDLWRIRRALAEVAKRLSARNLMRLYAFARNLEKEK
jgi:hypothetical protein